MTREELIARKKLEKEMSQFTSVVTPVSASEIIDSAKDEISEEEVEALKEALKSTKLSYFSVGDKVTLVSNKLKYSFVNGTSFRVSDTVGNAFVSIGNSSALYLHGVSVSEVKIQENKIKFFFKKIKVKILNLFRK